MNGSKLGLEKPRNGEFGSADAMEGEAVPAWDPREMGIF